MHFDLAKNIQDKLINENDFLNLAVSEYIRRRMSRGADRKTFGWSERLRGGKPEYLNSWNTALDNLSHVAIRCQGVTVECLSAIEMIKKYDSPKTLFYLDPPYLHDTRVTKNNYEFEMDEADHRILLECLKVVRGRVLLSGYDNPIYNEYLVGWKRHVKSIVNHSSQKKQKPIKLEVIWSNDGGPV